MTITRRVAALAALTLATAGLAAVAVPAATATAVTELHWQVSQVFDEHLSVHELGDGATEDALGVVTFPSGVTVPGGGGATVTAFDGSVTASFVAAGVAQLTVTIADPIVKVVPGGEGEVSAVVSSSNIAGMGSPAQSTDPARVVITTFTLDDGHALPLLSATPDWAGVLPEGAESVALGIGAGKPVDGKSFAVSFLGQLTPGIRPFFYATGTGLDAKKAPAALVVKATKSVNVESSYDGTALKVDVSGSGFSAITEPGDTGIYVGLAPAGGLPSTETQEDMDEFADAEWITPAQMADGTFSVTLDPENQFLDPSQQYAVYTWQAHTHSNPSQDTETPVEIIWSNLAGPTSLAAKVTKLPTTKKAGRLTAKITGGDTAAAGKLSVVLSKPKEKPKRLNATVAGGAATVRLPKLVKGTWRVQVAFTPSAAAYRSATKYLTLKVK